MFAATQPLGIYPKEIMAQMYKDVRYDYSYSFTFLYIFKAY